jgi:hypothetical protein
MSNTITAHLIGGPAHGSDIKVPANATEARVAVSIRHEPRHVSFRTAVYVRTTTQVLIQAAKPDAVPFVFKELTL